MRMIRKVNPNTRTEVVFNGVRLVRRLVVNKRYFRLLPSCEGGRQHLVYTGRCTMNGETMLVSSYATSGTFQWHVTSLETIEYYERNGTEMWRNSDGTLVEMTHKWVVGPRGTLMQVSV